MTSFMFDPNDPDRHLKYLEKAVGVSARIKNLTQKKRKSLKIETKEEQIEKILVSCVERCQMRLVEVNNIFHFRKLRRKTELEGNCKSATTSGTCWRSLQNASESTRKLYWIAPPIPSRTSSS